MFTHTPHSGPRSWSSNSSSTTSTPNYKNLYFSYSSNLSPLTMKGRHPQSLFAGLAILKNWRWSVNSLQYANIVPSEGDSVFGALYFITAQDEAGLDDMEGAPAFYQKQTLEVTRVNADGSETEQKVPALIYIDSERVDEGVMAPEYVVWIRKAIRDAKQYGLPDAYVEKYIRPHLPLNEELEVEKDMEPVRLMFSRDAFK